jgi:hypothetical protein
MVVLVVVVFFVATADMTLLLPVMPPIVKIVPVF